MGFGLGMVTVRVRARGMGLGIGFERMWSGIGRVRAERRYEASAAPRGSLAGMPNASAWEMSRRYRGDMGLG